MPLKLCKICHFCEAVGRQGVGDSAQELLHLPFSMDHFSNACLWQSNKAKG